MSQRQPVLTLQKAALLMFGLGTLALGWLSDVLTERFGDNSLRYAILAGTGFYLIAAAFFFASAKRLARETRNDELLGSVGDVFLVNGRTTTVSVDSLFGANTRSWMPHPNSGSMTRSPFAVFKMR